MSFGSSVTNRDLLLDRSQAGLCISGDPGQGKSVLMRQICRSVVEERLGALFLLDPHGDLARQVRADCLAMDDDVRRRLFYFEPRNDRWPVGCLNPLGVRRRPDESDHTYRQRLHTKAMHAAHLVLAATGETNFDQKPQLALWTKLIFRSLAELGMTIPDARFFLEVASELYDQLVDHLSDPVAQWEFRRLAELSIGEQLEEIGSTKRRLLGIQSPLMDAHLGGDPKKALDLKRMIHEEAIVIVNFNQGDELHDEELSVLGNFWLTEIFSTVVGFMPEERAPAFVCCDEMQCFRASAPMLSRMLRQIRKWRLRFVGAFQGVNQFEKGADDPMVKAMGQCGTTFVFRHKSPADAQYFGEMVQLPQHDPLKVKFMHEEDQTYSDENELVTLTDYGWGDSDQRSRTETDNWGKSFQEGGSRGETVGSDQSSGVANSTGFHERNSLSRAHGDTGGAGRGVKRDQDFIRTAYHETANKTWSDTVTRGHDEGNSATHVEQSNVTQKHSTNETASWTVGRDEGGAVAAGSANTRSRTITHKSQLVPVIKWRKVLKFIEFYSAEEQVRMEASAISRLGIGDAIMLSGSGEVERVRIPLPELRDDNPIYAEVIRKSFFRRLTTRIGYQTVPEIGEYRQRLAEAFASAVRLLGREPRILETWTPPPLPEDTNLTI